MAIMAGISLVISDMLILKIEEIYFIILNLCVGRIDKERDNSPDPKTVFFHTIKIIYGQAAIIIDHWFKIFDSKLIKAHLILMVKINSRIYDKKQAILCIGALHFDRLAHCLYPYQPKASNPVRYDITPGGVAHNIACDMAKLGGDIAILSLVGGDADGAEILINAAKSNLNIDLVTRDMTLNSASYTAVLDHDGDLATGLSDSEIYTHITSEFLKKKLDKIRQYGTWVIDANLSKDSIDFLVNNKGDATVFAAPVSPSKSLHLIDALKNIDIFIGNQREASIITGLPVENIDQAIVAGLAISQNSQIKMPKITIITMAADGAVINNDKLTAHFPIAPTNIVDANGAGDAFFAGFCYYYNINNNRIKNPDSEKTILIAAMKQAMAVASLTAEASGTIRDDLSLDLIKAKIRQLPEYIIY